MLEAKDQVAFLKLTDIGVAIKEFCREEDLEGLTKMIAENEEKTPLLKRFVTEAFLDVLHLKSFFKVDTMI